MMWPASCKLRGWGIPLAVAGLGWLAVPSLALAAETTDPVPMSKTVVILALGSETPLAIRTKFREHPPSLLLEFPPKRVIGSLPERSTLGRGAVEAIITNYHAGPGAQSGRFIQSLQIVLRGPYSYRVRSDAGKVFVELDHPASIGSSQVQVGLAKGTIIGGMGELAVSRRFRAMEAALTRASPIPWTLELAPASGPSSPPRGAQAGDTSGTGKMPAPQIGRTGSTPWGRKPSSQRAAQSLIVLAILLAGGAGALGLRAVAWRASGQTNTRLPSGLTLVDQLIWRAFERQGYQLIVEQERLQPPVGTLRVITKDGSKAVLLCAGHGPFFEKQAVEQFVRVMQDMKVSQGFLVASGSFTVPAQRLAKTHQVTLIGRQELTELLSVGAASEYIAKQLGQERARLEEAKETLRQYADELDTLRRQRNEASWYLGEERAKSAKLEADLAQIGQQLRHHELALQRGEQEAATWRRQWEESQWYLGESKAKAQELEQQLASAREAVARLEAVEHERAQMEQSLAEERSKHTELERALAQFQERVELSAGRERELEQVLDRLKTELSALRTHWGERRYTNRVRIPEAMVELSDGVEGLQFAGMPRDLSSRGIGIETKQKVSAESPNLRIRLSLPGAQAPIETTAQLMWQSAKSRSSRYQSGYQFLDLPDASRTQLEQLVEQFQLIPPSG